MWIRDEESYFNSSASRYRSSMSLSQLNMLNAHPTATQAVTTKQKNLEKRNGPIKNIS